MPKGTYGTPLVAKDGTVMGFYHLFVRSELYIELGPNKVNWYGFGISVSASELSRKGYELVVETELSDD